jgi:sodium/hydrogen antiporter
MDNVYVLLGLFIFLYSLIGSKVENSWVSGPLVFLVFGLVIGPIGLGWLNFDIEAHSIKQLADITLTLFLFIDAANANKAVLTSQIAIPTRMLTIGLPLTVVFGLLAGLIVFPEVGLLPLLVLATALAATDAALGKGILVNHDVPDELKESLNVESGLNDGLAVPILLFLFTLVNIPVDQYHYFDVVIIFAKEVGIGVLVGVGVTLIGVKLIDQSERSKWFSDVWQQIPVIALALLCFYTTTSFNGSGYIAAFTGGIIYGKFAKSPVHKFIVSAEGLAEVFAMVTWIIFGSVVIAHNYHLMSWSIVCYSILSLTLVRMIPIWISLIGTKHDIYNRLFLGWFGPRGLASIVFAVLITEAKVPHYQQIVLTIVCTIFLSVILHGISAKPLAKRFAK